MYHIYILWLTNVNKSFTKPYATFESIMNPAFCLLPILKQVLGVSMKTECI